MVDSERGAYRRFGYLIQQVRVKQLFTEVEVANGG